MTDQTLPMASTVSTFLRPTEAEIMANDWSITPGNRDATGCRTCHARPCEECFDWCGSAPPAKVEEPIPAPVEPELEPEEEDEPDTSVGLHWLKHYAEQINQQVEAGALVVRLEDGRVRLFARVVQEVAL